MEIKATNAHLSDAELPKAEEVTFTSEEFEFVNSVESQNTDVDDRRAFSVSKGAVGAAVVGGFLGAVVFGGVGAVVLAGGAFYATTKSKKVEKTGEKVYENLAKAGKATKKGMKKVERVAREKYAARRQRHAPVS